MKKGTFDISCGNPNVADFCRTSCLESLYGDVLDDLTQQGLSRDFWNYIEGPDAEDKEKS